MITSRVEDKVKGRGKECRRGQICRDIFVGTKKLGEGTKKYGTFYKDYAIETDIMMRAGAMVSALIIFLSVRVMKVMTLFFC